MLVFYMIRICRADIPNGVLQKMGLTDETSAIISIADLYSLVKTYDIDFHPGKDVDFRMENDTVNLIKSVYPYDDFTKRMKKAAENGNLVVTNKNKAINMLATIGIQTSEVSRIFDLVKNSIAQVYEESQGVSENSSKKRGAISDQTLAERDRSYLKAAQAYEAGREGRGEADERHRRSGEREDEVCDWSVRKREYVCHL